MEAPITGQCYCGATTFIGFEAPLTVNYCHCQACRRLSGAPVSAFAAFPKTGISFTAMGAPHRFGGAAHPQVERWFCPECGTQLAACYASRPERLYVPVGIIDQAADLPPMRHAHVAAALPWLRIDDDLPRHAGASDARLRPGPKGG